MLASKMALKVYETALRSGDTQEAAIAAAIVRAQSVVPSATDYDVREAISIRQAEMRAAARCKTNP
jgi:hypothetical protein